MKNIHNHETLCNSHTGSDSRPIFYIEILGIHVKYCVDRYGGQAFTRYFTYHLGIINTYYLYLQIIYSQFIEWFKYL